MKQLLLTIIFGFSLLGYAIFKPEFTPYSSEDVLFNVSHSVNRMNKTELLNRISLAEQSRKTQIKRNNQWFWISFLLISCMALGVFFIRIKLNLLQSDLSHRFKEAELIIGIREKRAINDAKLSNDLKVGLEKNLKILIIKIHKISNQLNVSESLLKQPISLISESLEMAFLNFRNTMYCLENSTITIQDVTDRLLIFINKHQEFNAKSNIILNIAEELDVSKKLESTDGLKLLWVLEKGIELGADDNENGAVSISINQGAGFITADVIISKLSFNSFSTNRENKIYKIKRWLREIHPEGAVYYRDNKEIEINLKVSESNMQKSLSFEFHY